MQYKWIYMFFLGIMLVLNVRLFVVVYLNYMCQHVFTVKLLNLSCNIIIRAFSTHFSVCSSISVLDVKFQSTVNTFMSMSIKRMFLKSISILHMLPVLLNK